MSQESQRQQGDEAARSRHGEPEEVTVEMVERGEATTVDVRTVDWQGNPILLKSVPAEHDPTTGKVLIEPAVVARAEMVAIASRLGIEGRDVPVLLTLFAEADYFVQGVIPELSKFNKLLFYQWKRLESLGLGEAYIHDEFANARGGPVPIRLKDDLKRLEKAGVVRVKWSESVIDPTVVELTPDGMKLAEKLWWATPEALRHVSIDVKRDLYPMTGAAIRERVHRDYPDARHVYNKPRRAGK